jgi:hypothetical protein
MIASVSGTPAVGGSAAAASRPPALPTSVSPAGPHRLLVRDEELEAGPQAADGSMGWRVDALGAAMPGVQADDVATFRGMLDALEQLGRHAASVEVRFPLAEGSIGRATLQLEHGLLSVMLHPGTAALTGEQLSQLETRLTTRGLRVRQLGPEPDREG